MPVNTESFTFVVIRGIPTRACTGENGAARRESDVSSLRTASILDHSELEPQAYPVTPNIQESRLIKPFGISVLRVMGVSESRALKGNTPTTPLSGGRVPLGTYVIHVM